VSGHSRQQRGTWRSPLLGEERFLDLAGGKLAYFDRGSGPAVVFVHGLLVNANLWRKVVGSLATGHRCITLDLPLGAHRTPAGSRADLSPAGGARMIAQALESLDLHDVTLVGNDTGGALCQIVATTSSERIGRLVLTSCDSRDRFPPALFRPLKYLVRVPGATQAIVAALLPRPARRLPLAFGRLAKRPIDTDAEDSYVLPSLVNSAVRAELRQVLPAIDPRYTREAASRLPRFDRPTLIAWSREDRLFPTEDAEELARLIPDARLEWIDDAYTFSMEDQPERLAELIAGFVREPARSGAQP
jgi:pimeloyl-ACP methyl ester carboxylesterase